MTVTALSQWQSPARRETQGKDRKLPRISSEGGQLRDPLDEPGGDCLGSSAAGV